MTGAPAAHCLKLLRQSFEDLAGSDRKHHGYVPVLDCTVADDFWNGVMGGLEIARNLMKQSQLKLFLDFVIAVQKRLDLRGEKLIAGGAGIV